METLTGILFIATHVSLQFWDSCNAHVKDANFRSTLKENDKLLPDFFYQHLVVITTGVLVS